MTEKQFANSERFIFLRNSIDNMEMVDRLNEFPPVILSDELAEVLSQILWEHTQFINEKKKGLFGLNNLKDFLKENNDLDKDVLIAMINNR